MSMKPVQFVSKTRSNFYEVCRELNMDKETEEYSWHNYEEISKKFSLNGDQHHWFCCSIFTACRESFTPTVGQGNAVVPGNCVSLTKLLRNCNISIYDFLNKIKIWSEMTTLSNNFLKQIDRLEHNFTVTLHIFQRYSKFFEKIFVVSSIEKKIKKSRNSPCCASKLYDFCWYLFLCTKNENSKYLVDIVTSLNLLLCCLDLVFVNVLVEKRIDLINPAFEGVPIEWNTDYFDPDATRNYCVIEKLCSVTEAVAEDVLTFKSNAWRDIIMEFLKTKTLYGDSETFMGIISNVYFEKNLKSLSSSYEQYVLSVGEFDERILLKSANFQFNSRKNAFHANKAFQERVHQNLANEERENTNKNIRCLQNFGDLSEPSNFICKAGEIVVKKIKEQIASMYSVFSAKFPTQTEIEKYFNSARSLYFYLLEKIVRVEITTKPDLTLKTLLETEIFNKTLFACCTEVVLNAHSYTQAKFPWVLSCFTIKAFHFYKIIEVVVRRHDGILNRLLIKHLNMVEEVCLETLVWRDSSPLWDVLQKYSLPLPSWTHVDIKSSNESSALETNQIQSPISSAFDCFNTSSALGQNARRGLFSIGKDWDSGVKNATCRVSVLKNERKLFSSVHIFLRKFFKLAWCRILDLCKGLDMGDEKYLNKIWTLFEYSITQRPELMQDRHLDQIIMCAIYLYIKVGEIQGKSFTDIMKFYRKQPQAASNTYREVLIEPAKIEADGSERKAKYDDIIFFYNNIYVQKMTPYALNFSDKKKSQPDLLLSPHPTEKANIPTKLTNNHFLYVHPLEKNETTHSPNNITYEFCKSPAKDLDRINEIVKKGSKRPLSFTEEAILSEITSKRVPYYLGKIQKIIKDRKQETKE